MGLRSAWPVHETQASRGRAQDQEVAQVKLPELIRKCPLCERLRPASKLDGGTCKDEKACDRAQANLRRIRAGELGQQPFRRDHWD